MAGRSSRAPPMSSSRAVCTRVTLAANRHRPGWKNSAPKVWDRVFDPVWNRVDIVWDRVFDPVKYEGRTAEDPGQRPGSAQTPLHTDRTPQRPGSRQTPLHTDRLGPYLVPARLTAYFAQPFAQARRGNAVFRPK